MIKKFKSVTSHALEPLPSHKLTPSQTFPIERDVLYGWPNDFLLRRLCRVDENKHTFNEIEAGYE